MTVQPASDPAPKHPVRPFLSPFRHPMFAMIWGATVVANIGGWMWDSASAWLMTNLDADPIMVSLVQVAANLPICLLALPAGALADIIDKRRLLLFGEISIALVSVIFAVLLWRHAVTPLNLLWFTLLGAVGSAITAPAWQSVVQQLVPRVELASAIAANSVGINISRSIGPSLGGLFAAVFGIAAPFYIGALSNLGSITALLRWKPNHEAASLPTEHLLSAMRIGLRHCRNNTLLRASLVRAFAFFIFASAYWALLPLIVRDQIAGGPELYGLLLGMIGVSAVAGATLLPMLQLRLGADRLVVAGTLGTAMTMLLFGFAKSSVVALVASVIAGVSWIAVLSSLNVSAQLALPAWVRGRGLALYVTVMFGSLSLGSVLWGQLAHVVGLPFAHVAAAAGALLVIPLTWRWKLRAAIDIDLTPSMHWPEPILAQAVDDDRGPVLVTVEYQVEPIHVAAFLAATKHLASERRRDGAYSWGIFQDVEKPQRFLETFLVESWLEHRRQHRRVTNADRRQEEHLLPLITGAPIIRHFIAPMRRDMSKHQPFLLPLNESADGGGR